MLVVQSNQLLSKTTPYKQTVAFQIKPYAGGTDAADQSSTNDLMSALKIGSGHRYACGS